MNPPKVINQACKHGDGLKVPSSWQETNPSELFQMMLTYCEKNGMYPRECGVCNFFDFTPIKKEHKVRELWLSSPGSLRYIKGKLVEGK